MERIESKHPELEALLLGKAVRTYIEGTKLTYDFKPYRINIELDKETKFVKKVWLG